MDGRFQIEFQDRGAWRFGSAGFHDIDSAIRAAKDLSEQKKALTRIWDAQTARVRSFVEVVFA